EWRLAFAACIALATTTIPALLEGKAWAKPIEALRCVGSAACMAAFIVLR
ncbi:MAG: hypothetical protein GQE15_11355, partial [Archangiaceae bacterium]|nr:hypothetical protein [Archangiaceae bacterium]